MNRVILLIKKNLPWSDSKYLFFFIPLAVYLLLCTAKIMPLHPLTGDEPHYLMITHSLLFDGDIELTNNYFENKDYRYFYIGGPLYAHVQKGPDGGRYPIHGPALSVLLLPAYGFGMYLGKYWLLFFCRATMALVLSFFMVQVYLLVRDHIGDRPRLLAGWLVVAFTPPIVFYAWLIYPEISAALCMIYPFRILTLNDRPKIRQWITAAAMLSLLPWLGIKYMPAQIVLILFSIILFIRNRDRLRGQLALFPLLSGLSLVLFLLYMHTCFGSVSPASQYMGATSPDAGALQKMLEQLLFNVEYRLKFLIPTLISYFIGQRVGLIFYAPVYILSFIGVFFFFRKNRLSASVLLLMMAAHPLLHAYSTIRGGHAPPPRPLMAVMWIPAFFMVVYFIEEKQRWWVLAKRTLTLLSFGLTLIFLFNPGLLYLNFLETDQAEPSRLLSQLASPALPFPKLFPSFVNTDWNQAVWLTLGIWGAVFLLFFLAVLFHLRKRRHVKEKEATTGPSWSRKEVIVYVTLFALGFLFWKWASVVPFDREIHFEGPKAHHLYFHEPQRCWVEEHGFWVKANASTKIELLTPFRIGRLRFVMRGREGNRLRLTIGEEAYTRHIGESNKVNMTVLQPEGRAWKGRFLYSLSFTSIGGWVPDEIYGNSDTRQLGFFVKIFPS